MSEAQLPAGYVNRFVARRKLLSLGRTFRIEEPDGRLLFFVRQKAFKLKEDIRVYADEGQNEERLTIKAASWLDFSGQYVVTDSDTGEVVGGARRKGMMSSFVRDHWLITDEDGETVGELVESGGAFATLRKMVPFLRLIPQKFEVYMGDEAAGLIGQDWGLFDYAYTCVFDPEAGLDPRMAVALVILLLAIEEAQD